MIQIKGITTDKQFVVSGVYDFHSTYGLPLEELFSMLKALEYIPSWTHFFAEAIENGVNLSRLQNKLRMPVIDIYGKDMWEVVEKCFSYL